MHTERVPFSLLAEVERGAFAFGAYMGDYDDVPLVPWTPSYKKPVVFGPPLPRKRPGPPTNAERGLPPTLSPAERRDKRRADDRAQHRVTFRNAVTAWIADPASVIESIEEVGESAYLAKMKGKAKRVPVSEWGRLATLLPGIVAPLEDNHGALWFMGRSGQVGWLLIGRDRVDACLAAQALYLNTVPKEEQWHGPLPFTSGGLAGLFLRWVGHRQERGFKSQEDMLLHPSGVTAYNRAIPGLYPSPHALWDVQAYYYNLIAKMPTPDAFVIYDGELWGMLEWLPIPPHKQERWDTVIKAISPHKLLRNALWGKMHGSDKTLIAYSRKHPSGFASQTDYGPYRLTARLIARVGHELTQRQALETGSPWAHTDAVVLPVGIEPEVWRSKGLYAERKAIGEDARVVNATTYRVGNYRKGGIENEEMLEMLGGTSLQEADTLPGGIVPRFLWSELFP